MDSQNNTLIREYPVIEYLVGLALLAVSVFTAIGAKGDWTFTFITSIVAILFLIFAASLVVTADRITGTLTIRRTSLLRRYKREIPISNIAAVQLESSRSSTSSGSSTTYRIVVITKDNETIPLRTSYSSGMLAKEAKAKKLREFLGVGGQDLSLGGIFRQATGMAQQAFQEKQEALTGPEADAISYLAAVVRGDIQPSGLSSLELNMTVMEILDAARESAWIGKRVDLPVQGRTLR